jgi:hypothetical protein
MLEWIVYVKLKVYVTQPVGVFLTPTCLWVIYRRFQYFRLRNSKW